MTVKTVKTKISSLGVTGYGERDKVGRGNVHMKFALSRREKNLKSMQTPIRE